MLTQKFPAKLRTLFFVKDKLMFLQEKMQCQGRKNSCSVTHHGKYCRIRSERLGLLKILVNSDYCPKGNRKYRHYESVTVGADGTDILMIYVPDMWEQMPVISCCIGSICHRPGFYAEILNIFGTVRFLGRDSEYFWDSAVFMPRFKYFWDSAVFMRRFGRFLGQCGFKFLTRRFRIFLGQCGGGWTFK